MIEQILAAAKVMQIRQRKESKINSRNPHWLKKNKKKKQRREQRLTFKDQIKRIGKTREKSDDVSMTSSDRREVKGTEPMIPCL